MAERHCVNPEQHCALHACQLQYKERNPEIDRIFQDPRFACANCGTQTHEEENLCNPKPI